MMEKRNIKNYIIILISVIFLFQNVLQKAVPLLMYTDEIVSIFLYVVYILKIIKRKKIERKDFKLLVLILCIFIIGYIGNNVYRYQTNNSIIIWDFFNVIKVFLSLYGAMSIMEQKIDKRFIVKILSKIIRVTVIIAFFCCIISLFKDIGMSKGEIRYGIKSFSFIYTNAGMFALYIYMYLFIITINMKYEGENLKSKMIIAMLMIICASTLRTRAFAFIVIYLFIYRKVVSHKEFKIKWYYIIAIILIAIPIGYNSIVKYFGEESTAARNIFYINSIDIAKKNMPIGTGFATYGTDMAFKYYSQVYYRYGMNKVHGLNPESGKFAHDTYWPAIIGQFGILGLICMGAIIHIVYKKIWMKVQNSKYDQLAAIFVIYVTAFSSIATAEFFHYATVAWFFLIPLMFEESNDKIVDDTDNVLLLNENKII